MGLPGTYLRCDFVFENSETGARAKFALWFTKNSGSDPLITDINTLATEMYDTLSGSVCACLPIQVQFAKVVARWRSGTVDLEGFSQTEGGNGSVTSSDILPEEDVVVFQRRTGKAGRNKRGRFNFPFVPETFQDDGKINGTGMAAYLVLASDLQDVISAGTGSWKPAHVDFKTSTLENVIQIRVDRELKSRRDRRHPKISDPVAP